MSFDIKKFTMVSTGMTSSLPRIFIYESADILSDVIVDDFFLEVADKLVVESQIFVSRTGTERMHLIVTAVSSTTVTTAQYEAATIQTALSAIFGGGSATHAVNIPGLKDVDLVQVTITESTNPVSLQKSTPTTDTLTILMTADPGADTRFDIIIYRRIGL